MNSEESKEFFKELRERIYELRIAHLFEEPCPLYDEDDWWDCRLIYDHDEEEE